MAFKIHYQRLHFCIVSYFSLINSKRLILCESLTLLTEDNVVQILENNVSNELQYLTNNMSIDVTKSIIIDANWRTCSNIRRSYLCYKE